MNHTYMIHNWIRQKIIPMLMFMQTVSIFTILALALDPLRSHQFDPTNI